VVQFELESYKHPSPKAQDAKIATTKYSHHRLNGSPTNAHSLVRPYFFTAHFICAIQNTVSGHPMTNTASKELVCLSQRSGMTKLAIAIAKEAAIYRLKSAGASGGIVMSGRFRLA